MSSSPEDSKVVRNVGAQQGEGREPRALADDPRTKQDGTALTMDERIAMLRQMHTGDILPDPNQLKHKDPEMHYFWASTTNQSDPIYRRQQLGYEFVKAEELPELAMDFRVKDGLYEGCIMCNEMLLMKIPNILAEELMKINHHERPLEEERRVQAEAIKTDAVDRDGTPLGGFSAEDRGFKSMVNERRAPKTFL